MSAAAGLAVMHIVDVDRLQENAREVGTYVVDGGVVRARESLRACRTGIG